MLDCLFRNTYNCELTSWVLVPSIAFVLAAIAMIAGLILAGLELWTGGPHRRSWWKKAFGLAFLSLAIGLGSIILKTVVTLVREDPIAAANAFLSLFSKNWKLPSIE